MKIIRNKRPLFAAFLIIIMGAFHVCEIEAAESKAAITTRDYQFLIGYLIFVLISFALVIILYINEHNNKNHR